MFSLFFLIFIISPTSILSCEIERIALPVSKYLIIRAATARRIVQSPSQELHQYNYITAKRIFVRASERTNHSYECAIRKHSGPYARKFRSPRKWSWNKEDRRKKGKKKNNGQEKGRSSMEAKIRKRDLNLDGDLNRQN